MLGSLKIRIGRLVNSRVYGGPYRDKPPEMVGVKMAVEVDRPCKVDIPVRDFSVPGEADFLKGLHHGVLLMAGGSRLYVGCMGGKGRTGLYLAGLAKVMSEYRITMKRPGLDPVQYVRENYYSHAVETSEQEAFIDGLDVWGIIDWVRSTQEFAGLGGWTVKAAKPSARGFGLSATYHTSPFRKTSHKGNHSAYGNDWECGLDADPLLGDWRED